jgi:hypothetical protein
LKEKDADLSQGLDARGKPLKPVQPKTAEDRDSEMGPADPSAPALMPAYAVSRTRLLLEGEAIPQGAHFWWEYDPYTGDSWGRILDYHRKAKTKRDVIGLSPAAVARVRDQVMRRWLGWKMAGLRPGWRPDRAPIPQLQDIVVRGGTDYDQYTYGIGGGDAATLRDALARRRATGFYQYESNKGLTAYGGPRGIWEPPTPPKPPPAPKPAPKPPKPPKPVPVAPDINEAVQAVEKLGFPARVVSKDEMPAYAPNAAASFDPLTNQIRINRDSTYWSDPSVEARLRKMGWAIGYSGSDIGTHEVGHALHWQVLLDAAGGDKDQAKREWKRLGDDATWRTTPERERQMWKVRKLVGRNAAMDPAEFVADVYAAIVNAGRTFPKWIMDLYELFQGPPLP